MSAALIRLREREDDDYDGKQRIVIRLRDDDIGGHTIRLRGGRRYLQSSWGGTIRLRDDDIEQDTIRLRDNRTHYSFAGGLTIRLRDNRTLFVFRYTISSQEALRWRAVVGKKGAVRRHSVVQYPHAMRVLYDNRARESSKIGSKVFSPPRR